MGMASLYVDGSDTFDVTRLVSCALELLHKQRTCNAVREELENREHRTKVDLDHLKSCQQRLKASLDQNERDLAQQQERERQVLAKNRALSARLKEERDEVKRLQSSIAHRDAQHRHDLKKRERELTKLKERVHTLLNDKTEKRVGEA